MMIDEDGTADSTDFQFETMKTPFERATEGKPKVRAVPYLGIYFSRVPVEELKQLYGVQTNAHEFPITPKFKWDAQLGDYVEITEGKQ